jgi:hypothetical protein
MRAEGDQCLIVADDFSKPNWKNCCYAIRKD